MQQTQYKTAKERIRELRQLYLKQQRTQAEARLTRYYHHHHIHLEVAALSYLLNPEIVPCPADTSQLLNRLNQDADYVVAYNTIKEGYHPSAVADALSSHMCDLDYPQSPEYVNQIIGRAQVALDKEFKQQPCLAVS